MDIVLIALLTLVASAVGTLTGFGTSTIMVPAMVAFYPLAQTLLLVGIVHWFGDIWKMLLFRQGARWRLVLLFGFPGIAMSIVGGLLVFQAPEEVLSRVLGAFLLAYVAFILVKSRFKLPETTATALLGGTFYGLTAGVFGVGGAVRGAFLAAYDLPKEVYIFTSGAIGLAVDTGRLATYWAQGAQLDARLSGASFCSCPSRSLAQRWPSASSSASPRSAFVPSSRSFWPLSRSSCSSSRPGASVIWRARSISRGQRPHHRCPISAPQEKGRP